VLAGNYPSTEDKIAQRTLKHIKTKFQPEYLAEVNKRKDTGTGILEELKTGGVFRRTPGRPTPLSGAFLTINPLLTPEEAARRNRDPLLLKLNTGGKYNLLDNPGKYTLVVATSYIESKTTSNANDFQKALAEFQINNDLDDTATAAWQLAQILRDGDVPFRNNEMGVTRRNFEAYVFHDRYGSIVTIGAFNSVNDPMIAEYMKIFGAKVRTNPQTGKDALIAEVMTLPDPKNPGVSQKSWIFDPTPRLIEVPDLR
jgi:hypothetical protein